MKQFNQGMVITKSSERLDRSSLPLTGVTGDWFGDPVDPVVEFGFGVDPEGFHFRATRRTAARHHPGARPGEYVAELWKHDVAEFFLAPDGDGPYLEFNLAPNGAWWSCSFSAPRKRVWPDDRPLRGVRTSGNVDPDRWEASISIPRASLCEHLRPGPRIRLNATFIIDSPQQRFLTAADLGPGVPDFHQPDRFPLVDIG